MQQAELLKKNTGPLTSPFPNSLHESFGLFHYTERTDHNGIITRSNTHNSTKIYVHGGNKIGYDDTFSKRTYIINKFSCRCIHCKNGVAISSNLIIDNNVQVWHFNDTIESFVQVKTDDDIFCQHNYNKKVKS